MIRTFSSTVLNVVADSSTSVLMVVDSRTSVSPLMLCVTTGKQKSNETVQLNINISKARSIQGDTAGLGPGLG